MGSARIVKCLVSLLCLAVAVVFAAALTRIGAPERVVYTAYGWIGAWIAAWAFA